MSIVSVTYWWMFCRKKRIYLCHVCGKLKIAALEKEMTEFRRRKIQPNSHWPPSSLSFFLFFFLVWILWKTEFIKYFHLFFFLLGSPFGNNQRTLWLSSPWHWTHICNTCLHSSGKRITFAVVWLLYVCIYISNQNVKSEVKLQGFCKNLLPILIWTLFFLN